MVRKTKKKAPVRKPKAVPRKTKTKTRAVPTRTAKKRTAKKRTSAIKVLENAIEAGIADLDDVAVSMGLLGAVEPARKRKKR